MSQTTPGTVVWVDLTVADAAGVRDFYQQVVGWQPQAVDMGVYSDFNMMPPGSDQPAAGICYARGVNADLPPQWLVYVMVTNMAHALEQCHALGGRVVAGPRDQGIYRFSVIQDPAGAVMALLQTTAAD